MHGLRADESVQEVQNSQADASHDVHGPRRGPGWGQWNDSRLSGAHVGCSRREAKEVKHSLEWTWPLLGIADAVGRASTNLAPIERTGFVAYHLEDGSLEAAKTSLAIGTRKPDDSGTGAMRAAIQEAGKVVRQRRQGKRRREPQRWERRTRVKLERHEHAGRSTQLRSARRSFGGWDVRVQPYEKWRLIFSSHREHGQTCSTSLRREGAGAGSTHGRISLCYAANWQPSSSTFFRG